MKNLDLTGLPNNILLAAQQRNLSTDGFEHAGRILYENGISIALETFQNAQSTADPQTLILVELTYLQQDLKFCDEADASTRSNLTQAIQSFEDALRCLKIVEGSPLYRAVDASYPTASVYNSDILNFRKYTIIVYTNFYHAKHRFQLAALNHTYYYIR